MKVILLRDVPKVGKRGEVKDVNDGFARNFLFAQNAARPATESAVKTLETEKARVENEIIEETKKFRALAEKLKSVPLVFPVKMGERGRAFGSVGAAKIYEALKKAGINIEKDWIDLDDPIKTSGEHVIKIKFPHGVEGKVAVVVKAE